MAETKTETTAKTEAQPAPEANPQAGPGIGDLSIADLKNIATVIDVASTRGAFRANEMATIGAVYNKLQAFLLKVTPKDQAPEVAKQTAGK